MKFAFYDCYIGFRWNRFGLSGEKALARTSWIKFPGYRVGGFLRLFLNKCQNVCQAAHSVKIIWLGGLNTCSKREFLEAQVTQDGIFTNWICCYDSFTLGKYYATKNVVISSPNGMSRNRVIFSGELCASLSEILGIWFPVVFTKVLNSIFVSHCVQNVF